MMRHVLGLTDEARQAYRDEVLATSHADFEAFAGRLERVAREGSVAVVGSEKALHAANEARRKSGARAT